MITLKEAGLVLVRLPKDFKPKYLKGLYDYLAVVTRLKFIWAPKGIVVRENKQEEAEAGVFHGAKFAEESFDKSRDMQDKTEEARAADRKMREERDGS